MGIAAGLWIAGSLVWAVGSGTDTPPAAATPRVLIPGGGGRELVDQVAAEVNRGRIMLSEVLASIRPDLAALPADLSPDERHQRIDALIRVGLYRMIRERLFLEDAERHLTEAQRAAVGRRVDERLAEMEREAGGREVLKERLRSEGRSLDALREDVRRQVTVSTYVSIKLRPGLHVTRRQLLDYYERHRGEFQRPERRSWRVVMIRKDRFAEAAAARSRAEDLRRRAEAGADFAALAREFSHGLRAEEGGLWGPMGRADFAVPEVVAAVFSSLKEGEVSPVIEAATAFYLVRIETVEPGLGGTFAEAQEEIRRRLLDDELGRRREALVRALEEQAFLFIHYGRSEPAPAP